MQGLRGIVMAVIFNSPQMSAVPISGDPDSPNQKVD